MPQKPDRRQADIGMGLVPEPGLRQRGHLFPMESSEGVQHRNPDPRIRLLQGGRQGLERPVGMDRSQRLGRLAADRMDGVRVERAPERLHGRTALAPTEGLHRKDPSEDVVGVLELSTQHRLRRIERDLGQDRLAGVDPDQIRRRGQRDMEVLALACDLEGLVDHALRRHEPDRQRDLEQRDLLAELLDLADCDLREPGLVIPRLIHLQLGMMTVVQPLVEESVPAASRYLLEHPLEVGRLDDPEGMPLEIGGDGPTVQVLSELGSDHVEHPRSLRISAVPELVHRLGVAPPNDRRGIRVPEDRTGPLQHRELELILAELIPGLQGVVIGREPFVEPEVAPVATRNQVPEPLVRELMGHQATAAPDRGRFRREQRPVGQHRDARVLHATGHEVVDRDLVVFRPGERHTQLLLEESHHGAGVLERRRGVLDPAGRGPEGQRDVAVAVLDGPEMSGDEADQVADMGLLLDPGDRDAPGGCVRGRGHLTTIRPDHHPLRNAAGDLGGELLVGGVVAGEPMPGLDRLPLRPEVGVAFRIPHLRRPEVQALGRLGVVPKRHRDLMVRGHRLVEDHRHLVVVIDPTRHGIRGGDRVDPHGFGVEAQLLQRERDRLEADGGDAVDRAGLEVGGDVDGEVEDVDLPARGVLRDGSRGGPASRETLSKHGAPTAVEGLLLGKAHGAQSPERQRQQGSESDEKTGGRGSEEIHRRAVQVVSPGKLSTRRTSSNPKSGIPTSRGRSGRPKGSTRTVLVPDDRLDRHRDFRVVVPGLAAGNAPRSAFDSEGTSRTRWFSLSPT